MDQIAVAPECVCDCTLHTYTHAMKQNCRDTDSVKCTNTHTHTRFKALKGTLGLRAPTKESPKRD